MITTRRYADVYLAPNLFRNGGFETGDLDFWSLSSSFTLVLGESLSSKEGCLNYARVLLSRETPTVLSHSFDFYPGNLVDNDTYSRYDLHNVSATVKGVSGDAIRGASLTSGCSLRVEGGVVNVFSFMSLKSDLTDPVAVEPAYDVVTIKAYDRFSSNIWKRVSCILPESLTEEKFVYEVGFKFEVVSGSPVVYVGNLQLVEGEYTSVPYTGCLFSKMIPKGLLLFCLAGEIPPGFELVSSEPFFIRSGEPGADGGSLNHNHEYIQHMRDSESFPREDDWVRVELLNDINALQNGLNATGGPDKAEEKTILIDDGRESHEHKINSPGKSDNSLPLHRKYLLCRKK